MNTEDATRLLNEKKLFMQAALLRGCNGLVVHYPMSDDVSKFTTDHLTQAIINLNEASPQIAEEAANIVSAVNTLTGGNSKIGRVELSEDQSRLSITIQNVDLEVLREAQFNFAGSQTSFRPKS